MVTKSLYINEAGLQPFENSTFKLAIELGESALSVVLWNRPEARPMAFEMFSGAECLPRNWDAMVQQSDLLGFKHLETLVVLNFERAAPVPLSVFTPALIPQHLELLFAPPAEPQHSSGDVLATHQMVMAWQMPLEWQQVITQHFAIVKLKALMSTLLMAPETESPVFGHLVVFDQYLWLALFKNHALLLCRTVAFQRPEDLSYHLLNICQQCHIATDAVQWRISGMTAQHSLLWEAVAKYFNHVVPFEAGCPVPEGLPGHYFAHLYAALR